MASKCFLFTLCVAMVAYSQAQTARSCNGFPDGFYPNPNNCAGFIQCSNNRAFPQDCPPGTRFDRGNSTCEHQALVWCDTRPDVNNNQVNIRVQPTFQRWVPNLIPFQVNTNVNRANVVRLPLFDQSRNGPALSFQECNNVAAFMRQRLEELVTAYDPTCTALNRCLSTLPVFSVQCLQLPVRTL